MTTLLSLDPPPPPKSRFLLVISAVLITLTLWALAAALPVWNTRSDHGNWGPVQGILPALIGFLGILVLCPAWFANLFLPILCFTLVMGRRVGFVLSLLAFAVASTAYFMPAIYGDNETAVIVERKIGFYLWLASFLTLILAHALLIPRTDSPSPLLRIILIALLLLAIPVLELTRPVRLPPLEAALEDPADAPFLDALKRNPSQTEKDAALPWAIRQDLSKYERGGRSDRLEKLIAAGVNVNQADRGDTPLMQVLRAHNTDALIILLLRAGADVNARDFRGKIILDIARESNASPQTLKLLTDAGAIPSVPAPKQN